MQGVWLRFKATKFYSWLNTLSTVSRRRLVIGLVAGVLLLGAGLLYVSSTVNRGPDRATNSQPCPDQPAFKPILPSGKTISELGGWKPLCPPGSAPTYAYSDRIGQINLSVTQQRLPRSFRKNTELELKNLAESEHYPKALSDNDGTIFYIGSSAKGPQSVITVKKNLLVFLKSDSRLDDADWINYLSQLN